MNTPLNKRKRGLSIIVPVWNEQGSIAKLIEQINKTLTSHIHYEIIMIDDHSTDNSKSVACEKGKKYPVRVYDKKGQRGKAQSIFEGLQHVHYNTIAMIDADLQYPPSALLPMVRMVESGKADIVVANRKAQETNALRQIVHTACRITLGKILHDLDCDIQSGLKVFSSEAASVIHSPQSNWAFDLGFLVNARDAGYTIGQVDIVFTKRESDDSKINIIEGTWQIASSAIRLKFK